jgi:hypothetical protein
MERISSDRHTPEISQLKRPMAQQNTVERDDPNDDDKHGNHE